MENALVPPRLQCGDRVRVVSPASPPSHDGVARGVELLTSWGLSVEVGAHAFDRVGYLAGTDGARLADINDALRDPGVRAIFATRGGKGAYRITEGLDVAAARRDPKPFVGFSDITHMHLALWGACRLVGMHGPMVNCSDDWADTSCAEALRRGLMDPAPTTIHRSADEATAALTTSGIATGYLMGGNLDALRTSVGCELPSLAGAILLIEDNRGTGLGQVDRALTQLLRCGALDGLRGVAVGQFLGFDDLVGGWTIVDVLRDRLSRLEVPILGGLPIGHGPNPPTVPLGTQATIDTAAGTLTVAAGVA